jgi:hypothetical protein
VTINRNLRDLQTILINQMIELSRSLDSVSDPAQAAAIVGEEREINHRITLIGSLLFCQQSKELEEKVQAVRDAKSEIERAIEDISHVKDFLSAFSNFLGLVDEAIDLAKLLK